MNIILKQTDFAGILSALTDVNVPEPSDQDALIWDNATSKWIASKITTLGSGAVAADHGTPTTDQVVNVCYGTGDPPAANTTTIGTLFIKYTA